MNRHKRRKTCSYKLRHPCVCLIKGPEKAVFYVCCGYYCKTCGGCLTPEQATRKDERPWARTLSTS